MGFLKKTEALKRDLLARAEAIRDFILFELNEAPRLRKEVYDKLDQYDYSMGVALTFIDFCISEKKGEWYSRCSKVRERIYEGIVERPIDSQIYLDLASRKR